MQRGRDQLGHTPTTFSGVVLKLCRCDPAALDSRLDAPFHLVGRRACLRSIEEGAFRCGQANAFADGDVIVAQGVECGVQDDPRRRMQPSLRTRHSQVHR